MDSTAGVIGEVSGYFHADQIERAVVHLNSSTQIARIPSCYF